MITAALFIRLSTSNRDRSVVLPLPRKPVMTLTGMEIGASAVLSDAMKVLRRGFACAQGPMLGRGLCVSRIGSGSRLCHDLFNFDGPAAIGGGCQRRVNGGQSPAAVISR